MNPLPSVHVPQPPGLKKSGVEDGHPPALLGGREVTGRLMLLHSRLGGFADPQGFVFVPGGHGLAILKDDVSNVEGRAICWPRAADSVSRPDPEDMLATSRSH